VVERGWGGGREVERCLRSLGSLLLVAFAILVLSAAKVPSEDDWDWVAVWLFASFPRRFSIVGRDGQGGAGTVWMLSSEPKGLLLSVRVPAVFWLMRSGG